MTTAARLIAALCLAALGYLGSEEVKTLMPEGTGFGYFTWVTMGLGWLCGWLILGPRAGRGVASTQSHALTATAALVLLALLVQATNEMVRLAMRHRYDGPMEAFSAIFEIALEFGGHLLDAEFFLLMLGGAVVTGLLVELAARHWR
ncbi:TrgA family protein [Salipiger marinus]|jgi:hypothetical protein|uniref:TrgA family protein n=1 Tax=Salipiger marinus TaxID=555512 RepID=UPI000E803E2D|nr:TrgA family protein [Salipiger manganoxidans]MCD1616628.1 TrgA family protein [Salipiger manganoxidans]MEB3418876.1 TrgA family protein [Salipiger manganoxidans]HBM59885.1 tellurium resistance protein [Citreicella sp.]